MNGHFVPFTMLNWSWISPVPVRNRAVRTFSSTSMTSEPVSSGRET